MNSTDQQINRSTDQQINRSTDQQINRSTDQQINRSTDQLVGVFYLVPRFCLAFPGIFPSVKWGCLLANSNRACRLTTPERIGSNGRVAKWN
jgi:hypothetical protein